MLAVQVNARHVLRAPLSSAESTLPKVGVWREHSVREPGRRTQLPYHAQKPSRGGHSQERAVDSVDITARGPGGSALRELRTQDPRLRSKEKQTESDCHSLQFHSDAAASRGGPELLVSPPNKARSLGLRTPIVLQRHPRSTLLPCPQHQMVPRVTERETRQGRCGGVLLVAYRDPVCRDRHSSFGRWHLRL